MTTEESGSSFLMSTLEKIKAALENSPVLHFWKDMEISFQSVKPQDWKELSSMTSHLPILKSGTSAHLLSNNVVLLFL